MTFQMLSVMSKNQLMSPMAVLTHNFPLTRFPSDWFPNSEQTLLMVSLSSISHTFSHILMVARLQKIK